MVVLIFFLLLLFLIFFVENVFYILSYNNIKMQDVDSMGSMSPVTVQVRVVCLDAVWSMSKPKMN